MKPQDVKTALKTLGGLFPNQLTEEQAKLLRDDLAGFNLTPTIEAIKEHRRTREFMNIPQLLEGCRAAERKASPSSTTSTTAAPQNTADFYRQTYPHLRDVEHDAEVILRIERALWRRGRQDEDAHREHLRSCTVKLQWTPGMESRELAEAWAQSIFFEPDLFATSLDQLRQEFPSSKVSATTRAAAPTA